MQRRTYLNLDYVVFLLRGYWDKINLVKDVVTSFISFCCWEYIDSKLIEKQAHSKSSIHTDGPGKLGEHASTDSTQKQIQETKLRR